MHANALRTIEFDRIQTALAGFAVTPGGQERLSTLEPLTEVDAVIAAQRLTAEGVRFHANHQGFPLRAPSDLGVLLETLAVDGHALEPLGLRALADHLESIDDTRAAISRVGSAFRLLTQLVAPVASFRGEIAAVRRAIEPAGDVSDHASTLLASLRDRLRRQRTRLRSTLESLVHGRDSTKYLQEQVVTDRNGRYVVVLRAEHRGAIPGIVHGASASGASLYVEPLSTVEINNDIVALQEEEAQEVRRILLSLTDAFRERPDDVQRTIEVGIELDVLQAKVRLASVLQAVEPTIAEDGGMELRRARHPLLLPALGGHAGAVPVDIALTPPARVLVITGPNTGGKTVALKTAGLLVAMAQSGLQIPVEVGSRLPVFRTLFADIGDDQSISASLSTFSAHITNIVSMDRDLALPCLVLLDEVGAGTDPVEGGALGTAVIDHFRGRGAHLIATTHYDSLKSYAATTQGVVGAAFGFDSETFAPTYELLYGSPGRSLALEIAARLGMPAPVIAVAREQLTGREQQLHEHLARVDRELQQLARDRAAVSQQRAALDAAELRVRSRESAVAEREEAFRRRMNDRLDERLREARTQIDTIVDDLKAKMTTLVQRGGQRTSAGVSTGEAGQVRLEARAALDEAVDALRERTTRSRPSPAREAQVPLVIGTTVEVPGLGVEGTIADIRGTQAELDVRGKRIRIPLRDVRALHAPSTSKGGAVTLRVDLQPRDASPGDVNIVGCTVDEALDRVERFLNDASMSELRVVRIIHGYGTGQLRRGVAEFLKTHPLVSRFEQAAPEHGGGGVTVVELNE